MTALQAPHLLSPSQVLKVRRRRREKEEEEKVQMIMQEGGNFCNGNSSIVYNAQIRVFNVKFSGVTENQGKRLVFLGESIK